ncbi:hypothetical protein EHS25_006747 [Saitozyma podzolica]|uniref:NIPA-like protein 3 n=1 Tax=Saitozyma podzolica TaxID=1890683 RepID=A0A427YSI4_9TREE|nr:hypothetical protein EHS25_006747 [Saitozyma podzolica]
MADAVSSSSSFSASTSTATAIATLTTSALGELVSSLANSTDGNVNGTSPLLPITDSGDVSSEGSYVLNTIIGLIIVVAASLLNAFGLNLTKLDHVRQQAIPKRERKKEYLRVLWLAGMGMYIASQLFGSTLALRWLRPDWVAPLGSSSLIFNFLFASWLVGTPVTPTDIRGTAVIVLGVILILVFSSINHGLSQSLSVSRLNSLWTRGSWLAYFAFLVAFTASTYLVSHLLKRLVSSRASFSPLPSPTIELAPSRPKPPHPIIAFYRKVVEAWNKFEGIALKRIEIILARADDARVIWLQGIGWAVAGGSLAGLCLVFTKAAVKLFGLSGHPFVHPSAILTVLLVALTAVIQIVCLNRALVCADTVVVVPLFYAGYTVFGFINSLIFYDEVGQYARWVLVAVFLSMGVLIAGVVLLSLKSSAKATTDPYTVSTEPPGAVRLRPRAPKFAEDADSAEAGAGAGAGPSTSKRDEVDEEHEDERRPREDVLWEVGSVSDDGTVGGEGGEEKRKGIGGGDVRGERRGLLVEDEDEGDGGVGGGVGTVAVGTQEREEVKSGRIGGLGREGGVGLGIGLGAGRSPVPDEAERNPFAEDDDEGFGEFEAVEASPKLER